MGCFGVRGYEPLAICTGNSVTGFASGSIDLGEDADLRTTFGNGGRFKMTGGNTGSALVGGGDGAAVTLGFAGAFLTTGRFSFTTF